VRPSSTTAFETVLLYQAHTILRSAAGERQRRASRYQGAPQRPFCAHPATRRSSPPDRIPHQPPQEDGHVLRLLPSAVLRVNVLKHHRLATPAPGVREPRQGFAAQSGPNDALQQQRGDTAAAVVVVETAVTGRKVLRILALEVDVQRGDLQAQGAVLVDQAGIFFNGRFGGRESAQCARLDERRRKMVR
jgi:hypothetical protein